MIAKRPDQDDHGREQASAAGAAVLLAHNRKNEHSSNTLEIYRIEISDPRRPFSIGRPIDHGKQQRRARNNGGCTPHGRRGSMGFVFFLNTRAAYYCIKTRKKLVQCLVTTQMERTLDGHKPTSQLNTTRKINSHMNYSHPAQPKRLPLSVALNQCSSPRRESSCSCSSTSETCPAMRPRNAAEVRERNSPPLALPKPPRAEACQPHRVGASEARATPRPAYSALRTLP